MQGLAKEYESCYQITVKIFNYTRIKLDNQKNKYFIICPQGYCLYDKDRDNNLSDRLLYQLFLYEAYIPIH